MHVERTQIAVCVCLLCVFSVSVCLLCVSSVCLLCVSMGVCLSSLLQGDWEKVSLCYPAPSSPSPTSLSVHSSQQTQSWIPWTGAQHSLTAQHTLHISPSLLHSIHKPFCWHIGGLEPMHLFHSFLAFHWELLLYFQHCFNANHNYRGIG